MSDLSKKFSIHSCSSSLNSFFFFLTYYVQLYVDWIFWLEFQSPWPSFADWMGVIFQSCEHFSSKFIFLKMLNMWFVLFLRLTLQCWPVIVLSLFLTVFLDTGSLFILGHFILFWLYNILHKLLRPTQFLKKFMEILERSTLQK